MKRYVQVCVALYLFIVVSPSALFAQFNSKASRETGAATDRANSFYPTPQATQDASPTPSVMTRFLSTLDSLTDDDRVGVSACVCLAILIAVTRWQKKRSANY